MMLRENFRQTNKAEQSVYDEILAALQEMMPEQGAKLRDLARSLSEEYMRERSQAFEEMRPKHPEAPMTEQMIVEQAYYDQKDQEAQAARMERRLKDLQRRDEQEARKYKPTARPPGLRPPGSAQGITPSIQYGPPDPAKAPNQPFIPRMQGTDTAAHAMMLDRMQDPYADPMHLQRMRQSEAAAARSGGYPRPTQPSFGPIERTYRA
jgi:hypothetical protein